MRDFTNKFQIAVNGNKSEITLNFFHESPVIPDDNSGIKDVTTELISSLVMNSDTAHELIEILSSMLKDN